MPYTPTTWVDDTSPWIEASNLNNIEQGISDAHTLMVPKAGGTMTGELITKGPIHDVRAYGADPTGTTDSLSAINAAISALPSTGGVLLFPPGIFNISGTIVVGKPVTFQGAGGSHLYTLDYWTSATVIRRSGTSTTPMVQLGTGSPYRKGVNFRDLTFDGEGWATKALDLALWQGSDITNVGVKSCTQTALHLRAEDGSDKANVMFNTITGFSSQNTPNGIKLSGTADHTGNCCHNVFTRTSLFTTGISIIIEDADNCAFYTTTCFDTGDPGTYCLELGAHARANYFYHFQAGRSGGVGGVIVRTTVSGGGNVIYGYDRENGQPEPTFETGASTLEWTESGRNASGWNIRELNFQTNNVYVTSRNAAGTADVNMWRVNASNELETDTITRFSNVLRISDGVNFTPGSTTGTKIGTATTQKLGFFNATPIVQPSSTTDVKDALVNLGLLADGGATPLNLDAGALSSGTYTLTDAANIIVGTTTGTKIGTATTQKLGFFNATPIVQPSSTTDLRTALINLGLYASGGATPLNLNGGDLTALGGAFSGQLNQTGTLTNATAFVITPTLNLTASFVAGANISPIIKPQNNTLTQEYALQFMPSVVNDGGVSNDIAGPIHGIFARVDLGASYTGTVATAHGISLANPSKNGGSGVMTTYKGIHIDPLNIAGTNWGIYVQSNASFFGGGATFGAKTTFSTGIAALSTEGDLRYDSTRKVLGYHDGVRERQVAEVGYMPYAYPIGGGPTAVTTTAQAIAANGGTVAIPIVLEGHMLLQDVSFWNTDAATARGPVEFAIYEDRLDNANSLNLVTNAVGSLTSWTPSAASLRTITVTSAPVYLAPGSYWLVLKNNHASNTLGLGSTVAGTMANNTVQTKTLTTAAFGATLDFVAATWTKAGWVPGVRLQGRVFGQAAAF